MNAVITPVQLDVLRNQLKTLPIRYEETFNEFLDHYALLTEEKMATGLLFDEARMAAYAAMGGGEKLKGIEKEVENQWHAHYAKRHWELAGNCFRRPWVLLPALLGVLLGTGSAEITTSDLYLLTCLLGVLPTLVFFLVVNVPDVIGYYAEKRDRYSLKVAAMTFRVFPVWLPTGALVLATLIVGVDYQENNPVVTAVLAVGCCFSILYLSGMVRLYLENFRVRKA